MDLDRPGFIEVLGHLIVGVLSVVTLTAVAMLFCASYYQAVGRVDWFQLLR